MWTCGGAQTLRSFGIAVCAASLFQIVQTSTGQQLIGTASTGAAVHVSSVLPVATTASSTGTRVGVDVQ